MMRISPWMVVLAMSLWGCDKGRVEENTPPSVVVGEDVVTDDGPVRGRLASELVIFQGIPYAAPPTGNLRWAPPARPEPWTTPRLATAFGPVCPQAKNFPAQSEDCLTLNIWAHSKGPARAVLVWIHGGGFVEGDAGEGWYDGAELARRQDIVVVSVNYRLGLLGFLALPQLTAPDAGTGNWGLRDQIAALAWVRRNIAAFGGDPSRVMITGESAGGASVVALLASAPAQGLFQLTASATRRNEMGWRLRGALGVFVLGVVGCTGGPDTNDVQPVPEVEDAADAVVRGGSGVAVRGQGCTVSPPARRTMALRSSPSGRER